MAHIGLSAVVVDVGDTLALNIILSFSWKVILSDRRSKLGEVLSLAPTLSPKQVNRSEIH